MGASLRSLFDVLGIGTLRICEYTHSPSLVYPFPPPPFFRFISSPTHIALIPPFWGFSPHSLLFLPFLFFFFRRFSPPPPFLYPPRTHRAKPFVAPHFVEAYANRLQLAWTVDMPRERSPHLKPPTSRVAPEPKRRRVSLTSEIANPNMATRRPALQR